MANIFMMVNNQPAALETLLYVFKNQMELGKKLLVLTIKHRDGYKEYCRGGVDKVFMSGMLRDIECGDLILLEHYNEKINNFVIINEELDIVELKRMSQCMANGSYFMIPKGGIFVYFLMKNCPMASYTINKNDIISDQLIGNTAAILNNICGKIDFPRGMYATMRF